MKNPFSSKDIKEEGSDDHEKTRRPNGLLIFVSAVLIFSLGFWTHFSFSVASQRIIGNSRTPDQHKDIDFSSFWEALDKVKDNYVGDIDSYRLVEGAIAGMMSSLGDPFSVYIDSKSLDMFNSELEGTFEGIGAEISLKDDQVVIVSPLDGSPAEKAGILSGDVILMIDDMSTSLMTVDEAVSNIRGDKGTIVRLLIQREGSDMPTEIAIERGTITIKSLNYQNMGDGIGRIDLTRFDGSTKNLLLEASDQIKIDGIKGLILDLRNNPGGYLETAIDVASEFIKEGTVLIEEYGDGSQKEWQTAGRSSLADIPMVVLVNNGSASASEIVAGAIQDYERGLLIGERTFGKGTVQEVTPLVRGGALKITVARWLTPDGNIIDKNGLSPDIEVKWDGAIGDVQLEKAIVELKNIL